MHSSQRNGNITNSTEKMREAWVPWHKDWVLAAVVGLVFGLDQLTKYLVRASLSLGESFPTEGAFRIVNTYNTGSAFGLFRDQTLPLILASALGIGILILVYRNHAFPSLPLRLSLGLQIGGAAGNLLDRVRMGHVTDFVDLGPWPVFNLADASIVVGIVVLVWLLLRSRSEAPYSPQVGAAATERSVDLRGPPNVAASSLCPVCDSPMAELPQGQRCYGCGALEWIEPVEEPSSDHHGLSQLPNTPLCPMCDTPMEKTPRCWRCSGCGALAAIEPAQVSSSGAYTGHP